MLVLLSPAKSLDFSPIPESIDPTEPRFQRDTRMLVKRAKKLDSKDLRKLMGISEKLAVLNAERFDEMKLSFSAKGSKPAVLAFTGDVYKGLDAGSLTKRDLQWAQGRLRILSGLYGVLRPLDRIQPYRLEMGTSLENPRGSNLYQFWGEKLAESLNDEARDKRHSAILNLASNEYFGAVPREALKPRLVTAVFHEIRDGRPRTISFLAKKARGFMARWIVEHRVDRPEGLVDFDVDGYSYREELSDPDRLVFARP